MTSLRFWWRLGAAVVLVLCPFLRADFLTIYGGPTYDYTTGNGYQSGFGVGFALKGAGLASMPKFVNGVNRGVRTLRWDTTGAVIEFPVAGNVDGYSFSQISDANPSGVSVGLIEKYDAGN